MKKYWKIFTIAIFLSIITPIIIGFGVSQDILNDWTNDNDWIGFWGSYAGAVIGSIVTLLVLWRTLEDNRLAREREEKVNYYNNLINTIALYLTDLDIYLSSIIQLVNFQKVELYNDFFQAKNQVIKSSIILCTQLHIKQGTENVDKIIECIESIEEKVKEIGTNTNVIWRENFRNRENKILLV